MRPVVDGNRKTGAKEAVSSLLAVVAIAVAGCAQFDHVRRAPDEAYVLQGPAVTDNTTPLESAFVCMADKIKATGRPPYAMTVGNVKDYTGKFSESDGGNPITQGGALMVMSALGKLGDSIRLRERFDVQVAEIELAYLSKRYLGDGQKHAIPDNGKGLREVPWLPYLGGSILDSDYFIVGGITELNFNIQSGGAELRIDNAGPKARLFTINVAADLRIVKSRTLEVIKTTSMQKQVTGYEVETDIFRFFGDILVDWNAGVKSQEPLQLAVRTTLELGVLELVGHIAQVDYLPCVGFYRKDLPATQEANVAIDGNGAAASATRDAVKPAMAHPKVNASPVDRIEILEQRVDTGSPTSQSADDNVRGLFDWLLGDRADSNESTDGLSPVESESMNRPISPAGDSRS